MKNKGKKGNIYKGSIREGGTLPSMTLFGNSVLGIDPGNKGAFVLTDSKSTKIWEMPISESGEISFNEVMGILNQIKLVAPDAPAFLERAVSFGMGTKGAFNYGKGVAAIEIALMLRRFSTTQVEPVKWTKVMHAGISADLKGKVKSMVAVRRLFPKLVPLLPVNRKGVLLDGPVDALLIAGYGLKTYTPVDDADFY